MDGADPAAAVKQISAELQKRFDEAGMGKVAQFTDVLEDTLDKVRAGPGAMMKAAQEKFDELKGQLQAALDDPASLAPGGGGMAACAAAYGSSVAGKLGALKDEAASLAASIARLTSEVEAPMKQLSDTLGQAMGQLEGSLKALAKLPQQVAAQAEAVKSPEDVARIDTEPLKQALHAGDLDAPLNAILGLKTALGPAVEAVRKCIVALQHFVEAAPDKVRHAFDVPTPLCFLTSVLLSQAPKAMRDLLATVDRLKAVQLQPLVDTLTNAADAVGTLDVGRVKAPVHAFSDSAKDLVGKLDRAVQAAKLASNPAGAAAGAVGKLGKIFG